MTQNTTELNHSLTRLTTLIRNLHSGIIVENENRVVILANQYFCDLFSITAPPDALCGMYCNDFASHSASVFKYPDEFIQRINHLLAEGIPVFSEILEMNNGKILERDFIPVISDNIPLGYLWAYRDVSELYQTKAALQQQNIFYEEILNNIPADIVVWNKAHKYIYLNKFSIKNNQIREWLIGKDDFEYCRYRNKDISLAETRTQIYNKGIEQKETFEFIEDSILPDGSEEYKIRRIHPVFTSEGELNFVIGYGLNITERIKAENALREAKKLAEASVIAKEIFLANVSHELRTPLNAIQGIIGLLETSELNTNQKKLISLLNTASGNLLDLVNDLLDVAQINRGEIELKKETFHLSETLNEINMIFKLQAEQKGLTFLHEDNLDENIFIHADKLRITQILNNILSNAIKFTDQGKIHFFTHKQVIDQNHILMEFRISDTGPGINPENQSKIFDAFTRVHPQNQNYSGTGLGLNITQKLVQLHQGEISVNSQPGKGSTFIIRIPFETRKNQEIIIQPQTMTSTHTYKILVVEDHPVNRFLLNTQLQQSGHTVENAESGTECLNILQKNTFDLILMDFQLPDIMGTDLIHEIKKMPEFKNIPVIAITANTRAESQSLALSLGFTDYISKPYKVSDLLQKINAAMGNP